jgi:hypothetical protein
MAFAVSVSGALRFGETAACGSRFWEAEVFLGHDQPERIVHDLDVMKNNHQGHEGTRSSDLLPA